MHNAIAAAAPPVLGIIGRSGSGKTTLLEYVVQEMAARGLRVNLIKHSHHDLALEPPQKDSARLRMAGAAEVLVASPYRFAIVHELRGAPEPTLTQQLARMGPADLTLVEGFKTDPIAKLEVFRHEVGQAPLYPHDLHVIAVASDSPAPDGLRAGVTWLNLNDRAGVLSWILQRLAK